MRQIAFCASVLAFLFGSGVATEARAALTAQWTYKNAPPGPGPRGWVDITYDTVAKKTVLFGGSENTYQNDIWHYDPVLNTWVQIEPSVLDCSRFAPPTRRDEYALEYDSFNNLYWTFGGSGYGCVTLQSQVGAGSTPTSIVDPALVSTTVDFYKQFTVSMDVPAGTVYGTVSGYNPATHTLTFAVPLSGIAVGRNYKLTAQGGGGTFYYSPSTRVWTGMTGPHWGYTGPSPISRLSPAMAYSPSSRAMLVFGGGVFNDTWAIDLLTKTWVNLRPDGDVASPPARAQLTSSMVYDNVHDVFILFGGRCQDSTGRCPFGSSLNDTWTFKMSTNAWTRMAPAVSPPPRQQQQMSFDSASGVAVLFGGQDAVSTFYNDTWVYDFAANSWTKLAPATPPGATYLGAMAYDPVQNLNVLYGGVTAGGASIGAVWTLKLSGGAAVNQPPIPVAKISPTSGALATLFQFDASTSSDPDGSIVAYQWNFGDGTATSAQSVTSHSYAAAATYTVTLTVTDNAGASRSVTAPVTVTASGTGPQISLVNDVISGTVNDPAVTRVLVNGTAVPVSAGKFQATVPLVSGTTVYTIQATGAGGVTTTRKITIMVQ